MTHCQVMPERNVLRHNTSSRSQVWAKIGKMVGVRSRNAKMAIFFEIDRFDH